MKKNINRFNQACLVIFSIAFLVTACSINIDLGNTQPTPAAVTAANGEKNSNQGQSISMNLNGIAQGYTTQSVDAVPESTDVPPWGVMPAHTILTLTGYPIQNHLMTPQIFIYPAAELAKYNEGATQIASQLDQLLKKHTEGKNLPFLPLFNASQVMHAQMKYLEFKNGKGVRFLTQFDQAFLPINNHELIYTFQGLTNDGKYYLAAVLPINLANLPADEKVNGENMETFFNNFQQYLDGIVSNLNQQSASSFTPDLSKLDTMIQSIELH
jgi:hypothetical protein